MMFAAHDDHDDALALCWHHRDLLSDDDYLACNEVARSWANNEPVSRSNYNRFSARRAEVRELVKSGQRYWCSCGCEDKAHRIQHIKAGERVMNDQQAREAEILAAFPTAEVDAWIIANMGYTAERLAALGKATRRDRRREARKAMRA